MLFHEVTYRLINKPLKTSAAAIENLRAAEKRLGVSFPAAVREWFSLSNGDGWVGTYSNRDHPIEIIDWELTEYGGQPTVRFKSENQGVCAWSFVLNGSADPPVLVHSDEDETVVSAANFSTYIRTCVWDYTQVLDLPFLVQANADPITAATLVLLRKQFTEEPSTRGWPGDVQHRFASDDFSILLWTTERFQSDWFVGARTLEKLETGLRRVWHLDQVGPKFYNCGGGIADELLGRLQDELGST